MVLTTDERVELMRRARQAKANKRLTEEPVVNIEPPVEQPPTPKVKKSRKKNEIAPLPVPVQLIEEDDEEEEVVKVPPPKKKISVSKFFKLPKIEPQKCCDEKVSHEEPLITDDEPQVVDKTIIIPSKKQIAKPRQPRASTPSRTLDITEPAPISELINELEKADIKYHSKQVKPPPTPSAPIKITYKDPPLQLFHY